ncbi:MAG: hypothetical protein U9Q71_04440 [Pseudomonadota bacterium]|nr:hypothetical protein [Pseudomonadota bacterium]
MDEEQFKRLKLSATLIECPFEKTIQQRRYRCTLADSLNIGERETVSCSARHAAWRCRAFLGRLRSKSSFAMGRKDSPVMLSYARVMQIQLGGLAGLAAELGDSPAADHGADPTGSQPPADIAALLDDAEERYGGVEDFPFSEIMRTLVHTRVRGRRQ